MVKNIEKHKAKPMTPEEKLKRLRKSIRKALKQIARSLKNRGFEAYYIYDSVTNDSYVILPLRSILKAIKYIIGDNNL